MTKLKSYTVWNVHSTNDTSSWASLSPYGCILQGHKGPVYAAQFAKANNLLASGSFDQSVRVWDVQTQREVRSLCQFLFLCVSLVVSLHFCYLQQKSLSGDLKTYENFPFLLGMPSYTCGNSTSFRDTVRSSASL